MKTLTEHYKTHQGQIAYVTNKTTFYHNEEPFYIASVGKLFTSTLIFQAIDEQKLSLDTTMAYFFPTSGLFEFEGTNYNEDITIEMCLRHESGLADYFEDPNKDGKNMLEIMMEQPDHLYTPKELLKYCEKHQLMQSNPYQFHYSDTNYLLLGLILESIYQQSFHDLVQTKIVQPLGLVNTYVLFNGTKRMEGSFAPLYLKDIDVSQYESLSSDYAGGGIVSTSQDLVIFLKAFYHQKLFQFPLKSNMDCDNKFHQGIYYGLGQMEVIFKKFFPLFFTYPNLYGHIGITGCLVFYELESQSVFIVNENDVKQMNRAFKELIYLMHHFKKAK